jgi:hypothetical protein
MKESDIQRTILDGLAAMHIWHMRCNSGGMYGSHKGKRWAVRFGRKGMADILAIKKGAYPAHGSGLVLLLNPIWIEVKRPGEKQTEAQIDFQHEVQQEGHRYILAHSWEEVCTALNG